MFPERLPARTVSSAERQLFALLRYALPDDFVVLHGLDVTKTDGLDAEIDFVVAHPDWGYLVIEVKGGGVAYDQVSGDWFSVDRRGVRHALKQSPVSQAVTGSYALRDLLAHAPATRTHRYRFGWAVAFPDITWDLRVLPNVPGERVLDRTALQDPAAALWRAFRSWGNPVWTRRAEGERAVRALTTLGKSWSVPLRLGDDVQETEQAVRRLTEEQYRVLDMLRYQSRALIRGCAGSGKTFLALEKARRLVREGRRVLLLCFNRPLMDWMRGRVQAMLREMASELAPLGTGAIGEDLGFQCDVFNFHGLVTALNQEAGGPRLEWKDPYDESLVLALLNAVAAVGARYDAIIVDEGQDFHRDWWFPVENLLCEGGLLYIFYDSNQRIYNQDLSFPVKGEPFVLPENCRSTQRIHDSFVRYYQGDRSICRGPEGRQPEIYPVTGDGQLLRRTLHRLCVEERVAPEQLVILTPHGRERSTLRDGQQVGNYVLTWQPETQHGDPARQVLVSTIQRFKGLERPVVILAEMESLSDLRITPQQRDMLLYVGLSRAMAHLIILGGPPDLFAGVASDPPPAAAQAP